MDQGPGRVRRQLRRRRRLLGRTVPPRGRLQDDLRLLIHIHPCTRVPLVDAYLWIKLPGESDGRCTRNTAGTIDPEYGIVDPPAGTWSPDQAHALARNAAPRLTFNR
ncbi:MULTISPECIES: glycoside hydrolase family 6 protein [Streptomyces]|uniref:glycoside hydrolase family 6 protein n=1 Tax=Streptomyces TaxID=1883 RepID=UPI00374E083C